MRHLNRHISLADITVPSLPCLTLGVSIVFPRCQSDARTASTQLSSLEERLDAVSAALMDARQAGRRREEASNEVRREGGKGVDGMSVKMLWLLERSERYRTGAMNL